jgi:two-component system KDP operon response regulator KdpE
LRILIIEDSYEVADAVSICFQVRWPEATIVIAPEGHKGLELWQSGNFDVVILDINLPDISGFEVLKQARTFSNVPTIALTVRGREEELTHGLELGADDYIVKPFRPMELAARVNAVLRRTSSSEPPKETTLIARGKLILDLADDKVHIGDKTATLTQTESRLLHILMEKSEETISSEMLSRAIWGESNSDTGTLRTYIRRLRDKLNDHPPQIILTEHGEGYRLAITE